MDKSDMKLTSTIFFNFSLQTHKSRTAGPRVTKFRSDKNTEELSGASIVETGYKQN